MTIQWLLQPIGELREWVRPMGRGIRPLSQEWSRAFSVMLLVVTVTGFGLPVTAWTVEGTSSWPGNPRKVVAAGVGYENAETSLITVKTYDAETGATLSEATYDLNVKEDAALGEGQPRERIFAGGVGLGTGGLSGFTLRVYDAATGKFLWQGLLNLRVSKQDDGSIHRVAAQLVPQALVTEVRSRAAIEGQPQFSLRASNPVTGQLVWTDQFSAGTGRLARAERVGRAVVGQTEGLAAPRQQIEFRIRMFQDQSRQLLWEDRIEPAVAAVDETAWQDDAAEHLPAWRGTRPEGETKEAI